MEIYHLDVRMWGEFTLIHSMKAREYWRGNTTCRNGDLFFTFCETFNENAVSRVTCILELASAQNVKNLLRQSTEERGGRNT
jgi:hypothetical protein